MFAIIIGLIVIALVVTLLLNPNSRRLAQNRVDPSQL